MVAIPFQPTPPSIPRNAPCVLLTKRRPPFGYLVELRTGRLIRCDNVGFAPGDWLLLTDAWPFDMGSEQNAGFAMDTNVKLADVLTVSAMRKSKKSA